MVDVEKLASLTKVQRAWVLPGCHDICGDDAYKLPVVGFTWRSSSPLLH